MKKILRVALVAAALASTTAARAQLTATLTSVPAPFSNAETALATASSLTLVITNLSTTTLHRLDIAFPSTGYDTPAGSSSGWTPKGTRPSGGKVGYVRFTTVCGTAGLAPNASATFTVTFVTPNTPTAADLTTTNFVVTGSNQSEVTGNPDPPCGGAMLAQSTTSFTAAVKTLLVTNGQVTSTTSFFAAPGTVTTSWRVTNLSSSTKYGVTVSVVATPAASSTSCTTVNQVVSGLYGTVTCTHVLSAGGSYVFAASASGRGSAGGAVNATAVGAYALPTRGSTPVVVQVGTPSATWTQATLVQGRRLPYTVVLSVVNSSTFTISKVALTGSVPGALTVSSAKAAVPAGSTLTYAGIKNNAPTFTGTLAAGATATLTLQLTGTAPATTGTYATQTTLTASNNATAVSSGQVRFVVPLPDIAGLTLLSDTTGQTLAWANTSGSGSTHDGVVIFRTAASTVPPLPSDFVDYKATPTAAVAYADRGSSTATTFTESTIGAYNYRVCNHDASFVYSDCSTGFGTGNGYVDSTVAPSGGWTHQLGAETLVQIGAIASGRAAVPTHRPDVTVLDLVTGRRLVDPVALPAGSLPPFNSPSAKLANGRTAAFIADQGGNITAVDLDTGVLYWHASKAGESFTAGVAGVTRADASAAFRAAYPMDVLFLGSATTGKVYAIDATNGATLWTVGAGASVYALIQYDSGTNYLYAPTSGAGIVALDLGASSPTTAARVPATWTNPGGTYRTYCVRPPVAGTLGCIDTSGLLRVLDRTTGALKAQLVTGVASPTQLSRVLNGTPGFVVGSSSQTLRVTGNASLTSLAAGGRWTPGQTLSPQYVNSAAGWIMVAASDLRLHKLSSETGMEIGQSAPITARAPGLLLGPPAFDAATQHFIFGTSEGRVWAIPANF